MTQRFAQLTYCTKVRRLPTFDIQPVELTDDIGQATQLEVFRVDRVDNQRSGVRRAPGLLRNRTRTLELRFRGSKNQRVIDVPASLAAGKAVESTAPRWVGQPL